MWYKNKKAPIVTKKTKVMGIGFLKADLDSYEVKLSIIEPRHVISSNVAFRHE